MGFNAKFTWHLVSSSREISDSLHIQLFKQLFVEVNIYLPIMTSHAEQFRHLVLLGTLIICMLFLKFDVKRQQPEARNLSDDDVRSVSQHEHVFSCENIESIKIVRVLGSGVSKNTYLGEYGDGIRVAVKMLRRESGVGNKHELIPMFMKEILLLMELKHKNIIKLLGFCIRSETYGTGSLTDEGIIAVYEYGEEVSLDRLIKLPLSQRLDIALEVLDLLTYLERSPLGSLNLGYVKLRHFLLRENSLKLIDLNWDSKEPSCFNEAHRDLKQSNMSSVFNEANSRCKFGFQCLNGQCVGQNAHTSLFTVNHVLLRHLLSTGDDDNLKLSRGGFWRSQKHGIKHWEQARTLLNDEGQDTAARLRQFLLDARSVM